MSRILTVLSLVCLLVASPVAAGTVGVSAGSGDGTVPMPATVTDDPTLAGAPAGAEAAASDTGGTVVGTADARAVSASVVGAQTDPSPRLAENDTDEGETDGSAPVTPGTRLPDPAVPPTGDGTVSAQATTPTNVTWQYELTPETPGYVLLHATYEFPDDRPFREYVRSTETVVSSPGFTFDRTVSNGYVLERTAGDNPDGPDAAITFNVSVNTTGFGELETADVGPWAFVEGHFTVFYQDDAIGTGPVNLTVADRSVEGRPVTYGGSVDSNYLGYVFVGTQSVTTYRSGTQTFEIVQPAAANATPVPARMGRELTRESAALTVGERDRRVTAFVAPDPIREGGTAGDVAFWMGDDEPVRSDEPTLLHEYVHTRQVRNYTRDDADSLAWFTEASASLYEAQLAWRFNYSSFADYRDVAYDVPSRVVLADDGTYVDADGTRVSPGYQEGMAVLAALDYRIRVATDGERSFQDVFRRVNARAANETLTASDLQTVAEAVAGRSFEPFFDRYVRSQALPDPPADPSAYPVETVPVAGSLDAVGTAGADTGRVYGFTNDEAFLKPDRPPVQWTRDTYGFAPVGNDGRWSLPVDPNRTETAVGSTEATWNYTFAYVQPQTRATANDGVPDVYPVTAPVAVDGPTDVGTQSLPRAHRLNLTVVDPSGSPVPDARVALGPETFASPVQVDGLTDAAGRAFARRGLPGIDVAGETEVYLAADGETAQVLVPSLSRASRLRYVAGSGTVTTGYVVPDEPVGAGEVVPVVALVDETAIDGSHTVTVAVDGEPVANATVDAGGDDSTLVAVPVTFSTVGNRSITVDGLPAGQVRVVAPGGIGSLPTTLSAPTPVAVGATEQLNATVSVPALAGNVTGTATVEFLVNGTLVGNRSLQVSDGGSRTVRLQRTFDTLGDRRATVRAEVSLNGTTYLGSDTGTVSVVGPANLTVDALASNEPVQAGETLAVEATLANVGGVAATQTATLRAGGARRDAATVTVPAGETRTVTLTWSTSGPDAGTYTATVATANDSATTSVEVTAPPRANLTVTSLTTDEPVVPGDTVTVTATVSNVGTATATQRLVLSAAGEPHDTAAVNVVPGGTTTVDLTWTTTGADAGTYAATVATANDSASTPVRVGRTDVTVGSLATNSPVEADGYVRATVRIDNAGTIDGTAAVTLSLGDDRIAARTASVDANGSTTVTVAGDTGARPPGDYTATVAAANDSRAATVTVVNRTVAPVTNGSSVTPPTDPDGDGEYEDVDGDGRASFRDIVLLFTSLSDPAVQADPGAFDFDGDGRATYADVVALFERQ